MKKTLWVLLILVTFVGFGSCSIVDSNDIEIIKPGDTVISGKNSAEKATLKL